MYAKHYNIEEKRQTKKDEKINDEIHFFTNSIDY